MKRVFSLVGLAALLTACETTDPTISAGEWTWAEVGKSCQASSPTSHAPTSVQPASGTSDSYWAAVAREVPGGWGGFFFEDGEPTIYLVDPLQKAAAVPALEKAGIPVSLSVVVKKGRWDFAEMYDWNVFIRDHLGEMGPGVGVHAIDIHEGRNRLEYHVIDLDARDRLGVLLSRLDVPCFLVAVQVSPIAVAL